MINRRTLDLVGSVFFVALGAILFFYAPESSGGWMTNAGFWPQILGLSTLGLGVIMGIQGWRRSTDEEVNLILNSTSALMLISFFLYVLLLPFLGFFLGTVIWMFSLAYLTGERRWWVLISFTGIVTIISYVIFWVFLGVSLPIGTVEKVIGLAQLLYY